MALPHPQPRGDGHDAAGHGQRGLDNAPRTTGLTFTRGSVILNWVDQTPVTYTDLSTWDAATGNKKTNPTQEVRFNVWRAPVIGGVTGAFVDIADVPANSTTYTDTTPTLVPTTTYDYKITAWNETGDSAFSNITRAPGLGATTTTLASAPNPSLFGQSVTFTATVADDAALGTPIGGTVQFKDGAANLGTPVAVAGGTATLVTGSLSVGNHSITAVYSGDAVFATSTSSARRRRSSTRARPRRAS